MKYPDVTAGQVEACINRLGGWDKFMRYIGGQGKIVFDQIFTLVGTATLAAQPAKVLSWQFVVNGIGFSSIDSRGFFDQFRDLESPETGDVEVAVNRLEEETPHMRILKELGDKAEINPLQFLVFVVEHKGSYRNFTAFLRGTDKNLWAVTAVAGNYSSYDLKAEPVDNRFYTLEEGTYVVSLK